MKIDKPQFQTESINNLIDSNNEHRDRLAELIYELQERVKALEIHDKRQVEWNEHEILMDEEREKRIEALEDHTHGILDADEYFGLTEPKPATPTDPPHVVDDGVREQPDKQEECKDCNGTGKEICDNPDHGFIIAIGKEIGRLGCPGCGHDPDHFTGSQCETCGGTGKQPDPQPEPKTEGMEQYIGDLCLFNSTSYSVGRLVKIYERGGGTWYEREYDTAYRLCRPHPQTLRLKEAEAARDKLRERIIDAKKITDAILPEHLGDKIFKEMICDEIAPPEGEKT